MKKALTKLVLLGAAISLVGCASNTQNQNTGLGAVAGGVTGGVVGAALGGGPVGIAAGVVGGALIGGVIGHNMDSTDSRQVVVVVERGRSYSWVNHRTHTRYTIIPSRHYVTVNGNHYCREYTAVAKMMNGKVTRSHGLACRQGDGSWMAVQ